MLTNCVRRGLIRPYEGSAFRQKYILSSPQAPSFAVDWVAPAARKTSALTGWLRWIVSQPYPRALLSRTSRKRRATIISSPGWSIQTPTTIVLTLAGMPAEAPVVWPVEGLSSMLGVPRRSSVMTSRGEIFNFSWL